ncbi:acyl-CoA carboxylase subunit epsilon [Amycolatopsis sp., V23-08]|uniref:Acyl-CoA carboxylase subunit epsilon n=1 Tax=Amycolatopsis heterodermiae TaxID=3110235 RepID=A0ABU5RN56_9PSEU|nr:acyl-CoA carboxylase subunit epsilon [Amycolatopsis sp., V23-08]MEA5366954.1 acyl-CoA carboxylase subunit epsilon [Amycolatopsis sp., V23-08]
MSTVDELVLVVRGAPDDASLAALVAVLVRCAAAAEEVPPPRSPWAGETWSPGPGAWRRSALPH